LPDHLHPQGRQLVIRLRELKDQMGVSTETLARRTAYSRSSWQRYLNGKTPPPRRAVEAIGRLAGVDLAHLLVLWELAEHARAARGREHPRRPSLWRHGPAGPGPVPVVTGIWRPLPRSLDPEIAYLVEVLRRLKDRSGLSLTALATATAYSRSSWERYLNGAKPPPRGVVEALARLTGEPSARLLALWKQSEARSSGRAAEFRPPAGAAREAR
jgi:transcriptional regulator with XRE-family HTH domain